MKGQTISMAFPISMHTYCDPSSFFWEESGFPLCLSPSPFSGLGYWMLTCPHHSCPMPLLGFIPFLHKAGCFILTQHHILHILQSPTQNVPILKVLSLSWSFCPLLLSTFKVAKVFCSSASTNYDYKLFRERGKGLEAFSYLHHSWAQQLPDICEVLSTSHILSHLIPLVILLYPFYRRGSSRLSN